MLYQKKTIKIPFGGSLPWSQEPCTRWKGAVMPPGEYDQTIRARRRCGLTSNYRSHLSVVVPYVWLSGLAYSVAAHPNVLIPCSNKRPQIPRLCFVGTFAQAAVASIDAVNLNGIVYARSAAAAAADSDRWIIETSSRIRESQETRQSTDAFYDTIRNAILTCARNPTWLSVSLIYRTEPTTKKCRTEKK